MTTTTTTSMRDWIIDCAVRWQRRHKLVVPKAGATADAAAAVIGPRDAALKPFLVQPAPEPVAIAAPAMAEPPMEQTMTVPMPSAVATALVEPPMVEPVVGQGIEPEVSTASTEAAFEEMAALVEFADEVAAIAPTGMAPVAEETPAAELPVELTEPEAETELAPVETAPEAIATVEPEAPVAETEQEVPPAPVETAPVQPPVQAEAVVAAAPAHPVITKPAPPELDLSQMSAWQVLILSGPAGSGKSSIAQQFCEVLPRSVHIKVEPLRDKAYSLLVAQPLGRDGQNAGTSPEVWSGKTEEAREQAADLANAYCHTGHQVIIDDVIESTGDLAIYQERLGEMAVQTVTLMPSLEEMERRDKMRPGDQQVGALRIKDFHAGMVRQLGQHSTVLDISQDTVLETVQRILDLLKAE